MNQTLVSVLERRRNKAIAVVLGVKERDVDGLIPAPTAAKLRKVVLDQFNEYHEMVLDVLKSLDTETVTMNQDYLDMLTEMHDHIVGSNGSG